MPQNVGYYPDHNIIWIIILYGFFTEVKYYKTSPVNFGDNETIHNFFKLLRKNVNRSIQYFCVAANLKYNSICRRRFIKISKNYNIQNVVFVNPMQLNLVGALMKLLIIPKEDDVIYVFNIRIEQVLLVIWEFKDGEWKCKENYRQFKQINDQPIATKKILKVFKRKIKSSIVPYIFVYKMPDIISEKDFRKIFSIHKQLKFSKNHKCSKLALKYARSLSGNPKFNPYKCGIYLDRIMSIRIAEKVVIHVPRGTQLPYDNETIITISDINASLKIYEDNELQSFNGFSRLGKYKFLFKIDINGIYDLITKHLEEIKSAMIDKNILHCIYFNEIQTFNIPIALNEYSFDLNAVGIDLGTTECCASVVRKHGPDFPVLDVLSSLRTMPSYVAFDARDPKCGQIVVDQIKQKSAYTVFDSKRLIGKTIDEVVIDPLWPFKVIQSCDDNILIDLSSKLTKTPEEISGVLLQHIKKVLESYQGQLLTEAVIAIPSAFTQRQAEATMKAAKFASWECIHFIPEPIAAAFAYFSQIKIENNSKILLFDCGGGTIDVCVVEVANGQLNVLSFDGDAYLGGRDFDHLLFNHFRSILNHKYKIDVLLNNKKYVLTQKCRTIKHTLSVEENSWLDVDDFDPNVDEIIPITRKEFEKMALGTKVRIINVIRCALQKSNFHSKEINYVFQVGGGCRMPMIKTLLNEIFPEANHHCTVYPDWIVAHGAALYAYHLKSNKKNSIYLE